MKRMTRMLMVLGLLAGAAGILPPAMRASVIAPPSDFRTFTNQADVVVVGTFTGTTERQWDEGRFKKTLIDLHFDVDTRLKTDLRSNGKASIVATTDTPQEVDVKLFTPGKQYVLFLKWDEHFQIYSLSYGLSGAYAAEGDKAVPMSPNTELVKRHGNLSQTQLTSLVRQAAAK